jgi:CubicO group peptidase (beta-lactamase class C family)
MFQASELEWRLGELIESHGIPGAQLAVIDDGEIVEAAAGVLSLRTQSPSRPDALFLPGSIGKLYTATLVMMLVGEGKIDLDTSIRTYLPDFQVKDPSAPDRVTVRNLLTHTSGFDGDHFADTGRGDDALARYIVGCRDLPQIAEPGKIWSYSNSSYAILGRIVEVVTGGVFEDVLRDRIFVPLALQSTVSFADQAMPHPVAVGHVPNPENPQELIVSPTWGLYRAFAPMGTAVIASAGDVLRFADLHLRGGTGPGGETLLDAGLVEAMQQEEARLVDDSLLGGAWGLGWNLDEWDGTKLIGHDGNSIGQNAFMRLAPGERFGFCLQTNVESAISLFREVGDWIFGERLDIRPKPDPAVREDSGVADVDRYAGVYEREGLRVEVTGKDGRLVAAVAPTHAVAEELGWPEMVDLPLVPVERDDSFFLKVPIADAELLAVFFNPDEPGGRPTYMHYGARAARRL